MDPGTKQFLYDLSEMGVMIWRFVIGLADSNFITAIAGAGGGALAAQWIAARQERSRTRLREMRFTNAAIMLAFMITNTFCGMKSQHVRKLKEDYDRQHRAFEDFQEKRQRGEIPRDALFHFDADFQSLEFPLVPVESLQKLILENVSVTGRALAALSALAGANASLEGVVRQREEVIEESKQIPDGNDHDDRILRLYFGLPARGGGRVDQRYPMCVAAIYQMTNDGIFFASVLMRDLVKYGKALAEAHGKSAPKIATPDFSKAKDLVPADAQYDEWLKAFVETGPPA